MEHFNDNVKIALSTLERYRYGPRCIKLSQACYASLRKDMESDGIGTFDPDYAINWCGKSAKHIRPQYLNAVYRLADVYEYGHVHGSHIMIYAEPSAEFSAIIEDYIADRTESGCNTPIHLLNIRHTITQFCCFAQYNGAGSIGAISYGMLDSYDRYMRESSRAFSINEGLVSKFFAYAGGKGLCKNGYSLYMHYIESDKCTCLSDLSNDAQDRIMACAKEGWDLSPEGFYQSILDFTEKLRSAGYRDTVTGSAPYHLTLLFLFLDRERLGYSRPIAEAWLHETGSRLFGKGVLMARRTFEMYDGYIRSGGILDFRWWKHTENGYDRLPAWCRDALGGFLKVKEKEGWKKSTINMYRICNTRFCGFPAASGIASFPELSPKMVKDFNMEDNRHETPEAKNAYNCRIRKFLIYLEMAGLVPAGIHLALPGRAAGGEKIVETLSEQDKAAIESYCAGAETPLELRDAAILMVAVNMGFRSCDVAGIRVRDIDWKNRSIRIIQRKTGVGHLHPMDIRTGNAIYRYIKDARRKDTGEDALFLKLKAPYGPVGRSACRGAMERAGVSACKFHLARKSFGSAVLNSGATVAETAEMLGHSDTASVHKYTALDTERMRLCPLSLLETGLSMDGRYGNG